MYNLLEIYPIKLTFVFQNLMNPIKTVKNINDFSYDEKNKFYLNSKNVSNNIVKYLINEKH